MVCIKKALKMVVTREMELKEWSDSLKEYFRTTLQATEKRLSEKIDSLSNELSVIKTDLLTVKNELSHVKLENSILKAEVSRLSQKNERDEKRSRRHNIRIEGIEFADGDADDDLPPKITKVLTDGGIAFSEADINKCHYSAKPNTYEGRRTRQVIAQLNNWTARESVHKFNRGNRRSKYRVNADLTQERYKLLTSARAKIGEQMNRLFDKDLKSIGDSENVFAYSNVNSELKIRARGHVVSFSSANELETRLSEIFAL